ncbi:hypothetical protein [Dapis sp. BLCC M229]|uniref:hypothetical protein n=1 Tax=Dapis sp. BLCC M229 TaxID=3400188 RepID=UPI003CEA06F3
MKGIFFLIYMFPQLSGTEKLLDQLYSLTENISLKNFHLWMESNIGEKNFEEYFSCCLLFPQLSGIEKLVDQLYNLSENISLKNFQGYL